MTVLTSLLMCACSSTDYYRLPRSPGADGSLANEVQHAFFSLVKPAYGLPHAYVDFNPDIDEEVVFFALVGPVRRSFTVRGVLHRPDGTEHVSFTRSPNPSQRGPAWSVRITESFAMTTLRSYPGRWMLQLFLDDVVIGAYDFVLADKTRVQEFRRPR